MRRFIVGTDWWTDCDDVIAMRMLARAAAAGGIEILGVGLNGCMEYSAVSLKGFLADEGMRDIPIGIDLNATDFGGNPPYQKRLAGLMDEEIRNEDCEDAVRMYRRLLTGAGQKVEIIEIGYPQVLAGVLMSGPDDISELCGEELFRRKVERLWVMAGKWDEEKGRENNFVRNERSRKAGHELCRVCPVPITFLGWEIGADVITGRYLSKDDPLHMAMEDHGSGQGRSSWDPMLVQLALIGDEKKAGYDCVQGYAQVDRETGENSFCACPDGPHRYVKRMYEPGYYEQRIEKMIQSAGKEY